MQAFETNQARALFAHCLSQAGSVLFLLAEGEDVICGPSSDTADLLAHVHSCDMMVVRWHDSARKCIGSFMLVFGNGPGELVADFTDNEACNAAWNHVQRVAGE